MYMKYAIPLIVVSIITIVIPEYALAQGLVPTDLCTGTDCSACHLVELANRLIGYLIGLVMMLFAVLVVWAGFKLVTSQGNPSALSDAKGRFMNAFIGLLIVLSAWLIVDTLMRGLLPGDTGEITGWGPWSQIQCAEQPDSITVPDTIDLEIIENFSHNDVINLDTEGVDLSAFGGGANCPAATESQVVTIPGSSYKARPDISSQFVAMRSAAAAEGITLRVTSGWRSDARQAQLYNQLCPGGTCGARKAARPCSLGGNGSNHNSGRAIDISVGCSNGQSGCNTATYNWLKQNGGRFGFYNNLPTDPLHWSTTGR